MNQVAIIGPGALGCLFAVRLMQQGTGVTLVDYREDRRRLLMRQGITLETGDNAETVFPAVSLQVPEEASLVLVLTKACALETLSIPAAVPTLTLQNGLGVTGRLVAKVNEDWLLAGTTTEAATLLTPGKVRHTASGLTCIGSAAAYSAEPVVAMLRDAGFNCVQVNNPREMRWRKAVLSAAINPLTALLQVPNGELVKHDESRTLLRMLAEEALAVAQAYGLCLDFDAATEAENLCLKTAGNLSSMLQDLRRGSPTEIEVLSGALLTYGDRRNMTLPATALIYRLIRSLEQKCTLKTKKTHCASL